MVAVTPCLPCFFSFSLTGAQALAVRQTHQALLDSRFDATSNRFKGTADAVGEHQGKNWRFELSKFAGAVQNREKSGRQ
jgi:hypothetical protein